MQDKSKLPLDYVTKDYDGFLEMMKEKIPTLTPEWTDTSDTDQGMVILQVLSYGLHIMGYYQDRAVNENILPLARTKRAVLNLTKFLGYTPRNQTPAIAHVTFKKYETDLARSVFIPKGTKVSTDPETGEPIVFETVEPLFIDAGVLEGTVEVEQGESVLGEVLGKGNGLANQSFTIDQPDVIDKSLVLQTRENNNDYFWTRVDTLFESRPDDRHYVATLNAENQTVISFGDGVTGRRIENGVPLQASYRFGGGSIGNVATGLINNLYESSISAIESLMNAEPATGGMDYESMEQAKALAPRSYRTGGKIVTARDLEDEAMLYPGIAKAKAVETYNDTNDIHAYLATDSGDPMTPELKEFIQEDLQGRLVMNQNLFLFDTPFNEYDLTVTAYINDNFIPTNVSLELEGVLRDYLRHSNFQLGETVFLSRIIEQAFFARGIRNVVVNSPITDIVSNPTESPKLANLTINIVGGVVVS